MSWVNDVLGIVGLAAGLPSDQQLAAERERAEAAERTKRTTTIVLVVVVVVALVFAALWWKNRKR